MTPEQISEAMWNLSLMDAVKVSISTDWIVFIRLWPLWALTVFAVVIVWRKS